MLYSNVVQVVTELCHNMHVPLSALVSKPCALYLKTSHRAGYYRGAFIKLSWSILLVQAYCFFFPQFQLPKNAVKKKKKKPSDLLWCWNRLYPDTLANLSPFCQAYAAIMTDACIWRWGKGMHNFHKLNKVLPLKHNTPHDDCSECTIFICLVYVWAQSPRPSPSHVNLVLGSVKTNGHWNIRLQT